MTHPKSPEPKDDDDEVHHVCEEHECIDICGGSVLGMEDVSEESIRGSVDTLHSTKEIPNYTCWF